MNNDSPFGHHKWLVLAVATMGLIISNGLAIGGLPVFSSPIVKEFIENGAVQAEHSQSFIANASIITFLMSGIFSLVGGWLLPKIGIRTAMIIGCTLLGLGFIIHSQAETIWQVYLCRFMMGASLGFVGVTPSVILVSRWFGRRKGTALGILLTGTSIGGFVMPLVFARMIALYQWRTAMLAASFFVSLLLVPLVAFFIRWPAFHEEADPAEDLSGLTLNEAFRTPQFWVFSIAAALVFYTIFVTTQQFILYLQTPAFGLSLTVASAWQSILFGLSVTGKSAAGFLSDRFPPNKITLWSTALMFLATLVLLLAGAPFAFLVLYGLGYGATFVLLQRLVAEYFGQRDYARILGTITMIEIFGGVMGGRVTGYLADRSGGDYGSAFHVMIGVTAIAFLCMAALNVMSARRKEPLQVSAP